MTDTATKPSNPVFDNTETLPYTHKWLEGSILDELPLEIQPLTDEQTIKYLGSINLQIPYKNGEPQGQYTALNADEKAKELFDEIVSASGAGSITILPEVEIGAVINATVMNVVPDRVVFRRGDQNAPPPGETVIRLTCWHGEHANEDGEPEQRYVETLVYFRTPKAEDYKRWEEANDKHTFERDGKGRVKAKHSKVDMQKVFELFNGSQIKGVEKLFLRAENYSEIVPFHHIFFAAGELLNKTVDLGKLSRRLNPQS